MIDLNHLCESSGTGLTKVAKEFTCAFQEMGFAYIVNHRVPQPIINEVFGQHRRFHEEKNKIRLNKRQRGYLPLASYKVKRESKSKGVLVEDTQTTVKAPNQSESFIINHEHLEGPSDATDNELYDRYFLPQVKRILMDSPSILNDHPLGYECFTTT